MILQTKREIVNFHQNLYKYNMFNMYNMKTQITVRDVDVKIFREFKAEATKQGITLGGAFNLAMEKFRTEIGKKRPKLTSWKPMPWGKGTEHVSEKMDDILYGEEQ